MPVTPQPAHRSRPVRPLCALLVLLAALPLGVLLTPRAGAVRTVAAIEVGGSAIVATTEGDQLALREGPDRDEAVLATFPEGTELAVLDGPVTSADGMEWYRVRGLGRTGWCAAEWLVAPGSAGPAPALAADPAPAAANGALRIGGTDGEGARLRDAPGLSGAIILVIPEDEPVVLAGGARVADGIDWAPVNYGDAGGWVSTAFLTGGSPVRGATAPAPAPDTKAPAEPPTAVPPAVRLTIGNRAEVIATGGYDLRIRDGVGLDAPVFAYAPAGTVLLVVNGPRLDGAGTAWYGIDYDGLKGWVLGEHLALTNAPLSRRAAAAPAAPSLAPAAMPTPRATPAAAPNPNRGRAIADEALKYLGTPYVWGGESPAGWDCSGFIWYIYQRVASITLPRVSQDQFRVGIPLRADEIRAGDLVFFADTDGPGITHNGIALGDGRFIHARTVSYGTVISNLSEPYWVKHYAGARRP